MAYDDVIDADNPISHWKMGETNNAPDRKGTTNLPAVNGPIAPGPGLVTDSGNAASVYAIDQRFGRADATGIGIPYITPAWTIESWINFTDEAPGSNFAFSYMTAYIYVNISAAPEDPWYFKLDIEFSSDGLYLSAEEPPSPGQTHHLVATYDETTGILYLDGQEIARGTMSGELASDADHAPYLGGCAGAIDEIAFYGHALTPERIQAHYLAGTGQTTGPPTVSPETLIARGSYLSRQRRQRRSRIR